MSSIDDLRGKFESLVDVVAVAVEGAAGNTAARLMGEIDTAIDAAERQVETAEDDQSEAEAERDEARSELAEFSEELADLRRNAPPPPSYPPSVGALPFVPFPRDLRMAKSSGR